MLCSGGCNARWIDAAGLDRREDAPLGLLRARLGRAWEAILLERVTELRDGESDDAEP